MIAPNRRPGRASSGVVRCRWGFRWRRIAALSFFLVPDTATRARGGIDWTGAALLSPGLATLMLGFSRGSGHGWDRPDTLALFAASAALLAAWTTAELRVEHPIVDVRAAARRTLWPVYTASLFVGVTLYASKSAAALFLGSPPDMLGYGLGYDTRTVGWMLLPAAVCAFVGSALAPLLARVTGPRATLVISGTSMAAGFVLLAVAHSRAWHFFASDVGLGLGLRLGLGMLPVLVLDASAADRTGVDTGIYSTAKTLGGSVSGAVFAAILAGMTFKGGRFPAETAYETVWWSCAAISLLAAATAAFLATPAPTTARHGVPGPAEAEASHDRAGRRPQHHSPRLGGRRRRLPGVPAVLVPGRYRWWYLPGTLSPCQL
ncbi:hypothetical protein [Embleya sp. MST-111070]|uniref:hypothetical protein n=1 Tax=Embleya sp. MST-111070 TaxID=3398231 RepID=UPI003F73BADD